MADIELVIRISEEKYKDIQGRDWKNGKKWFSEEWQAIHNGTPLDTVKAEIRKHCERYMDGDIIAEEVIQAVENIGKVESEVKDADSN